MARVIISSGHTSANPGSIDNGLREFDVARLIAKSTLKFLRYNGIISLSVPPDMELIQRIDWVNNTGYLARSNDIAVEIHINEGGKTGLEAWYEGDGMNQSQQLTELILNAASAESKMQNQGAKSEYKHEVGSIAFLHETNLISSLIECGYIDNPTDAMFLKSAENIDKLGKGIAKGICTFLNVEFKDVQPQPEQKQPVPQPVPNQAVNSFNNNGGFQSQPPRQATDNQNGAFKPLPSREERRKMIINNYSKILGREPSQNDINYFLNIGIQEDELLHKMIDSQEHTTLVKSKSEFDQLKDKFNLQEAELKQLKVAVTDQTRIIEGLNFSIMQKNAALQSLEQAVKDQSSNQSSDIISKNGKTNNKQSYRGSFLDRLFKAFSDLFE